MTPPAAFDGAEFDATSLILLAGGVDALPLPDEYKRTLERALRSCATLADELARVRAECGVRQIQGYVEGRTDRAELLQRWLDFHTAEAGMTAAIVCDRDRFDQFMTNVHSREQDLIADTKAALSISKRGRT